MSKPTCGEMGDGKPCEWWTYYPRLGTGACGRSQVPGKSRPIDAPACQLMLDLLECRRERDRLRRERDVWLGRFAAMSGDACDCDGGVCYCCQARAALAGKEGGELCT